MIVFFTLKSLERRLNCEQIFGFFLRFRRKLRFNAWGENRPVLGTRLSIHA